MPSIHGSQDHLPTDFDAFGLSSDLRATLAQLGLKKPTEVQAQAIAPILAGSDVQVTARTGSGKTAAYALPILQRLTEHPVERLPGTPRVLVLVPTRDLAAQTADTFRKLGRRTGLRTRLATGGSTRERQVAALDDGADILIATPGRLMDLVGGGSVHLHAVACLVLDEADQMLNEDFLEAMKIIVPLLPLHHQTLLFSATMPAAIEVIAAEILHKPEKIQATEKAVTPTQIRQRIIFAEGKTKTDICVRIGKDTSFSRVMVFTKTKASADKLGDTLRKAGLKADVLHGDRTQTQRDKIIAAFRAGRINILATTDVAARGLDIDDVDLVINHDMPDTVENYIHRIGRTGRGSKRGTALTLCAVGERTMLRAIERHLNFKFRVLDAGDQIR